MTRKIRKRRYTRRNTTGASALAVLAKAYKNAQRTNNKLNRIVTRATAQIQALTN